ncbi:PKD domain-containing protein [Conexibacter stalactiti]|uniref:PKD domain-containing protein n=1 Tax=Conexibacter stalactiti TaxID=1940611 RepID=A0ABU4HMF2_9ACTN|nr:PKD domain-containing protein [Conexibacter stalactiti]MDW5594478.1 hypothetical protein [Conexibacter stalactiti]MEC5035120.1 PKD domain-containing protein [Conexibacter stalactiti]
MRKTGALAAIAAAAMLTGAAPAAAGIWSEVPTPTTSTITAIEYQSDSRFWFTTANGEIWRRRADLSGFQRVQPAGLALRDIEFQPGGDIGFAVGAGGTVLRSINGGDTWTRIAGIPVSNEGDGTGNKCTRPETLGDVNFVHFAGPGRVWIGGPRRQLATSQPALAANVGAPLTWIDANRKPVARAGDNCWITESDGFPDIFVTADPDVFYFAMPFSEAALLSTDNLQSTPIPTTAGVANGFSVAGSLVGDPGSPNRMWSVVPSPHGNSTAVYTEDGWSTSRWMFLVNESAHPWPATGPYDVAFNGGTVLAAGNEGFIIHSTNGRDFFWNGADGAPATNDWRAVALASGTQGAVGGVGGRLLLSSTASATPDLLRPTGFIDGPGSATAGQPVGFTLVAADEGGSGLNAAATTWSVTGLPGQSGPGATFSFPTAGGYTVTASFSDNAGNVATATRFVLVRAASTVTPPPRRPIARGGGSGSGTPTPANAGGATRTSTGGATVTTYRRISLRKGGFVPVWVSARTARRFVIEIRTTGRRPRRVATQRARLGAGKKALVRVALKRGIRTGKYVVTVRVFQGRRAIGKRVRTAFVIAK